MVRSLVTHMEALCEDYGELGRALSHFARFEESMAARQGQYTTAGSTAVQRGGDLQKLGYGALRQHSLSKQVGKLLTCQPSLLHSGCFAMRHAANTTLATQCTCTCSPQLAKGLSHFDWCVYCCVFVRPAASLW